MAPKVLDIDAILFDMDGTLTSSTDAVEEAWRVFQKTYTHVDVEHVLTIAHGIRTVDNLKNFCHVKEEDLEAEAQRFEEAIVKAGAENNSIIPLPGVKDLLGKLSPVRHLPSPSWAICTSATRIYATESMRITNLPVPDVFITAEDVTQGKPYPDPYLKGAKLCGVAPERCIVLEDAPNGVLSGKAAGCTVIAVLTSHTRAQLEVAKPDFIIEDLTGLSVEILKEGLRVTIRPA